MMMNNVLVGLFLGLLAVVQMTPVPSVTEIPTKAEDDFLREAVTDGFLVNFFTTESPKTIATASQQPPSDPKEAVTEVPTEEPSEKPTEEPSEKPSEKPSEESSEEPSEEPSKEPSEVPNVEASEVLSEEPTEEPSEEPNEEPSEKPSEESSEEPSEEPTEEPSEDPTEEPSEEPSEEPNEEPSEESTTAVFIQHGGDHNTTTTDPSTTHSSPSGSTPSSVPNDAEPSTTTHTAAAQTTDPAVSSFLSTLSLDYGSGQGVDYEDATMSSSTTPVSDTDSSTAASTSTAAFIHLFEDSEGSGSGWTTETSTAPSTSTAILLQSTTPGPEVSSTSSATKEKAMNETSLADNSITRSGRKLPNVVGDNPPLQGASSTPGLPLPIVEDDIPTSQDGAASSTPGWIIILGFIVGVAMLVMLCVAIATRDKWNGPRKVSEAKTKTDSTDQQRGQEMATFLPKDKPMENGRSEYTVIPLEELPESYSSH